MRQTDGGTDGGSEGRKAGASPVFPGNKSSERQESTRSPFTRSFLPLIHYSSSAASLHHRVRGGGGRGGGRREGWRGKALRYCRNRLRSYRREERERKGRGGGRRKKSERK